MKTSSGIVLLNLVLKNIEKVWKIIFENVWEPSCDNLYSIACFS